MTYIVFLLLYCRGHTHALLEALVHGEKLVEVVGVRLQPPQITILPANATMGRRLKLSTVYNHAEVEIWFSTDGTVPKRHVSHRWKGMSCPINADVTIIRATAHFHTAVASPISQVPQEG